MKLSQWLPPKPGNRASEPRAVLGPGPAEQPSGLQCEHAAIVWRPRLDSPRAMGHPLAPTENQPHQPGCLCPPATGLSGPRWLWLRGLAGLRHPGGPTVRPRLGLWRWKDWSFEQTDLIPESFKED